MGLIKWLGGKSQVLHIFKDYFPNFRNVKGYIEPFIGGGNVFFYIMENYGGDLEGKPVYISDINPELINLYKIVRDSADKLVPLLDVHEKKNCDIGEDHYYRVRSLYPPGNGMTYVEKAAAFIYLSKAAFGGMWRVNSDGKMNTSYGGNRQLKLYDNSLLSYSGMLKGVNINNYSFEKVLEINGGDLKDWFTYMDPPYYSVGNSGSVGSFQGYSGDGYHLTKKTMLPRVFKDLDKLGCKVMMSNSDVPIVRKEFKDYNISVIQTNRMEGVQLSGITKEKIDNAERLTEVVVTNYKVTKKQKTIGELWD